MSEISGDTLFNSLLCIERDDGTLKATYRKRHLFGFQSKEQQILTKAKAQWLQIHNLEKSDSVPVMICVFRNTIAK